MTAFDSAATPGNVLERLARLEAEVRALQRRDTTAVTAAEMAEDMGEFATGSVAGMMQIGALYARYRVAEGEELVVPEDYVMIVPTRLELDGSVEINGRLVIL